MATGDHIMTAIAVGVESGIISSPDVGELKVIDGKVHIQTTINLKELSLVTQTDLDNDIGFTNLSVTGIHFKQIVDFFYNKHID